MTKLNQIVAVEKGVKATATKDLTAVYHGVQKTPLLSGISRTYQPKDDEGERLPAESTLVQLNIETSLSQAQAAHTRLFDVTLTKERANTQASADVVLEDGTVLLADVPVTYLLFLEKQLVDLRTFVAGLPTLDAAVRWSFDANTGVYATDPTESVRTKKVPKNWVKAEATEKHPAQVEVFHEDVIVGTWTTVKYSGALPSVRLAELQKRVTQLLDAVKFARETANSIDVTDHKAGDAVFSYLFGA